MLFATFKTYLESTYSFTITYIQPLTGGDINKVYLITTNTVELVLKLNHASAHPLMFEKEAKGLEMLAVTDTFIIPKVIDYGIFEMYGYLLLEYIPSGLKTSGFWNLFGRQLALLHQHSSDRFGLEDDNYIGSLPQYNKFTKRASDFLIEQRLAPQFKMAKEKGYEFAGMDALYKKVAVLVPNEPPSLIHGDLWSGNYMVTQGGLPVLIDPAVAYAPREMDLALMKLFGGFDNSVFSRYQEINPLADQWQDRILLYQLYYILVHLNLFGDSYYNRVQTILKKYG